MLSAIKKNVQKYLPRSFLEAKPVCQIYLNRNDLTTTFTLTHIPSLFSPTSQINYFYEVVFYDQCGREAVVEQIHLKRFASVELKLADQPYANRLPASGLFCARLKSKFGNPYSDTHLGRINPYFYTLYHDSAYQSLILVHPQSRKSEPSAPHHTWTSNLISPTSGLKKIEYIQINPTQQNLLTKLIVVDEGQQEIYSSQTDSFLPMTVKSFALGKSDFMGTKSVSIRLEGMTGQNSKPLVFKHFENGLISGSHT